MVSNSVGDVRDNCPTLANPCQEDSDANVCDIFPDGFESGDTTARSKHRWQLAEKIAVKPFHDRPELPSVG